MYHSGRIARTFYCSTYFDTQKPVDIVQFEWLSWGGYCLMRSQTLFSFRIHLLHVFLQCCFRAKQGFPLFCRTASTSSFINHHHHHHLSDSSRYRNYAASFEHPSAFGGIVDTPIDILGAIHVKKARADLLLEPGYPPWRRPLYVVKQRLDLVL